MNGNDAYASINPAVKAGIYDDLFINFSDIAIQKS